MNLLNRELNTAQHLDLEPKSLRGQPMVVWTWAPTRRILTLEGPPRRACHYRPLLPLVFVVHFRPALPSFSRPSHVLLRERERDQSLEQAREHNHGNAGACALRTIRRSNYFFPSFVCLLRSTGIVVRIRIATRERNNRYVF